MKNNMLILLMILLTSCESQVKFDSAAWKKQGVDWQMTDSREIMVNDLIDSDTLIGLKKSEIFQLIGKPEIESENTLKYLVREKYEWDIDPEYIKYLWVELDEKGSGTKAYLEKTK